MHGACDFSHLWWVILSQTHCHYKEADMKKKKLFIVLSALTLMLSQSMTLFAITESDVEAVGKETAAGNIFI